MTGTGPGRISALLATARAGNWHVERVEVLGVWTAERSGDGGRSLHFVVGHDVVELTNKILAAGQAEP